MCVCWGLLIKIDHNPICFKCIKVVMRCLFDLNELNNLCILNKHLMEILKLEEKLMLHKLNCGFESINQ